MNTETRTVSLGERQSFPSLTALRGIAAILVVVFHFSGGFLPGLDFERYTAFFQQGYLWVDYFFLLSGFVMAHAYGKTFSSQYGWPHLRDFVIGRLARIYPLHFTILIAFIILELVKLLLHQDGYLDDTPFSNGNTLGSFIANLTLVQSLGFIDTPGWNGPAWSIGAEWIAYLLFPLLALRLLNSYRWVLALALLASFAGLAALSLWLGHIDVTYDFGLLRCLLEFIAGIALYRLFSLRQLGWWSSDSAATLALLAIFAAMHFQVWDALIPILMALSIVSLAGNTGRVECLLASRPLIWLGTVSYSIYMSHLFILRAFEVITGTLTSQPISSYLDTPESLGLLAILLGIVLLTSHMLYHFVEDPARRAIRRRLLSPRRQPQGREAAGSASVR